MFLKTEKENLSKQLPMIWEPAHRRKCNSISLKMGSLVQMPLHHLGGVMEMPKQRSNPKVLGDNGSEPPSIPKQQQLPIL